MPLVEWPFVDISRDQNVYMYMYAVHVQLAVRVRPYRTGPLKALQLYCIMIWKFHTNIQILLIVHAARVDNCKRGCFFPLAVPRCRS